MSAVSAASRWNGSAQSSNSQNSAVLLGIFEQLELALETGDLGAALRAYNSLASQTQSAAGEKSAISLSTAIKTVGQQLASRNLAGARQALSNVGRVTPRGPSVTGNPADSDPVPESKPEVVTSRFFAVQGSGNNPPATIADSKTIDLLV